MYKRIYIYIYIYIIQYWHIFVTCPFCNIIEYCQLWSICYFLYMYALRTPCFCLYPPLPVRLQSLSRSKTQQDFHGLLGFAKLDCNPLCWTDHEPWGNCFSSWHTIRKSRIPDAREYLIPPDMIAVPHHRCGGLRFANSENFVVIIIPTRLSLPVSDNVIRHGR